MLAGAQMAEALLHLHARGIAHLDVKPDNIYTTPEGAYKLGDFGLACPCSGVTHTLPPEEGDSRCASFLKHGVPPRIAYAAGTCNKLCVQPCRCSACFISETRITCMQQCFPGM